MTLMVGKHVLVMPQWQNDHLQLIENLPDYLCVASAFCSSVVGLAYEMKEKERCLAKYSWQNEIINFAEW
jgi:hypothetical protein